MARRDRSSRSGWRIGLLAAAGVCAALVSDWFVDALDPAVDALGISKAFTGLVIVAHRGERRGERRRHLARGEGPERPGDLGDQELRGADRGLRLPGPGAALARLRDAADVRARARWRSARSPSWRSRSGRSPATARRWRSRAAPSSPSTSSSPCWPGTSSAALRRAELAPLARRETVEVRPA